MNTFFVRSATCFRTRDGRRCGISLIELVISMGLLSVLMLPILSLMATSQKVFTAGQSARDADYVRQTALDAVAVRLQSAQRITNYGDSFIDVLTNIGTTGRLSFGNGQVLWTENGVQQTLATGLSETRFQFGTAQGASTTAGVLLQVDVATHKANEPVERWSSTTIWIKPNI